MSDILNLLLILVITCCCILGGHGADWTYFGEHGTHHWAEMFPHCAGSSQSPINLQTTSSDDVMYDETLADTLDIIKGKEMGDYFMVNNGHTVYIDTSDADVKVFGASLGTTYKVVGPHFHWGSGNDKGSEHLINGVAYPLEMHIVSFRDKFDTVKDAVMSGEPGALAVVGVMFQVVDEDNPVLEPIMSHIQSVQRPDKDHKVQIDFFEVKSLLPGDTSEFFRYSGSLTTPTCDEVVTWTNLLHPQTISQAQLDKFRSLQHGSDGNLIPLVNNFRPVQPLNGRKIRKTFDKPSIVVASATGNNAGGGAAKVIGQTVTMVMGILAAILVL